MKECSTDTLSQKEARIDVCYVVSYYFRRYTRSQSMINAIQKLPEVRLFQAENNSVGIWRYVETLFRLIYIRLRYDPKVYFLGFRGHEIFWPVRLITWGRQLIFDELMSPWDSLINEKKNLVHGT